jgi:hypothetical protein
MAETLAAPTPAPVESRDAKPIAKVHIWDESAPWLIARRADRRVLPPAPASSAATPWAVSRM